MKFVNLYHDVNEDWYPATYSSQNKKQRQVRRLVEPIRFKAGTITFIVPKGFYTDLASVPRIFWWAVPPFGVDDLAFIIHDYFCYKKIEDYKTAVNIMREIQRKVVVPKWRIFVMYWAVRLFGPKWKNNGQDKDKE